MKALERPKWRLRNENTQVLKELKILIIEANKYENINQFQVPEYNKYRLINFK